jgi:hypothetical protein
LKKSLTGSRPFNPSFRNWIFSGLPQESLVIDNSTHTCMHLVEDAHPENRLLPPALAAMSSVSNLSRIQPDEKVVPPVDIFGPEPAHTWCYYFQKASLGRQFEHWDEIVRLGDEAQQAGFTALDVYEWFPFIEGYARTGDLTRAVQITRTVHESSPAADPALCELWGNLASGSGSDQLEQEERSVRGFLSCP